MEATNCDDDDDGTVFKHWLEELHAQKLIDEDSEFYDFYKLLMKAALSLTSDEALEIFLRFKAELAGSENEGQLGAIPSLPTDGRNYAMIFTKDYERVFLMKRVEEMPSLPEVHFIQDQVVVHGCKGDFIQKFKPSRFRELQLRGVTIRGYIIAPVSDDSPDCDQDMGAWVKFPDVVQVESLDQVVVTMEAQALLGTLAMALQP